MTNLTLEGLVLDMDGVFYVGDKLLDGATETLQALREKDLPFRFITNTTTRSPDELVEKLERLGLDAHRDEIFIAVSATVEYLQQRGKPSVYLLVRDSVRACFSDFKHNDKDPDFVVIGDIGASWDYETLNRVFKMLMNGSKLICMHRNKYFQAEEGLRMDIGAFVAALEYVSDKKAIVIGKPAPAFFQMVLSSLGLPAQKVAIVGDDIESDVGGGQAVGMQGILVKTGKYREEIARKSSVQPDQLIESIAALADIL